MTRRSPTSSRRFTTARSPSPPSPQAYLAGTAYDGPRPYYVGKGATGFGVRLLVESLAVGGTERAV